MSCSALEHAEGLGSGQSMLNSYRLGWNKRQGQSFSAPFFPAAPSSPPGSLSRNAKLLLRKLQVPSPGPLNPAIPPSSPP